MAQEVNNMVENVENVETVVDNEQQVTNGDRKQVINDLIRNGAVQVKNLIIKSAKATTFDEYTRISLTLDRKVRAIVTNDNGDTEEVERNVIFTSTYALSAILKDDDNAAFAANHLVEHPKAMAMLLSRAKITILQEEVAAGEEYVNPFSENGEPKVFDTDKVINHVIKIELSKFGEKVLDKLVDLLLTTDED